MKNISIQAENPSLVSETGRIFSPGTRAEKADVIVMEFHPKLKRELGNV